MAHELMAIGKANLGALPVFFAPHARAAERTIEFFTAHIRNLHTRKAYARAAAEFAAWCAEHGIVNPGEVRPVHIAAYVEDLQHEIPAPSVKQRLAAIRMLFDWLVVGQVIPVSPASSVRGPKHVVKKGKTPVL
jgi:site-specific recombinase XerC